MKWKIQRKGIYSTAYKLYLSGCLYRVMQRKTDTFVLLITFSAIIIKRWNSYATESGIFLMKYWRCYQSSIILLTGFGTAFFILIPATWNSNIVKWTIIWSISISIKQWIFWSYTYNQNTHCFMNFSEKFGKNRFPFDELSRILWNYPKHFLLIFKVLQIFWWNLQEQVKILLNVILWKFIFQKKVRKKLLWWDYKFTLLGIVKCFLWIFGNSHIFVIIFLKPSFEKY